jgi:hypothetical protein
LSEIEDAYDEDLDNIEKEDSSDEQAQEDAMMQSSAPMPAM